MKTYNFRKNQISLLGDSHSTSVAYNIIASSNVRAGTDIVHLGDIGIGFGRFEEIVLKNAKYFLEELNELAIQKDLMIYLQAGNHDFPKVWQQNWEFSNVFLVNTGDIGVFPNGKKALFAGGGVSIDRARRVNGIDYWTDEITPEIKVAEKYDIVLAHDCPEHFNHSTDSLLENFPWLIKADPTLIADCKKQRDNMTRICEESGAKYLFSSHFHNKISQEKDGVKYRCIDINELYYLDTNEL